MRTSRISRETDRVIRALRSPLEAVGALRRSSRSQVSRVDSPLQTDRQTDEASHHGSEGTGSKKRKRGLEIEVAASAQNVKDEALRTPARQSPRKAIEQEDDGEPSARRKAKRQPAKRIKGEDGSVTVEAPPGWERVYNVTAEMRKRQLAPVDTMGCESLAEYTRSPIDQRLQTLVALMLSSQTKDTVTAVAMKNLQDNVPGGFCLQGLLDIDPVYLNELITKVGFHNNKTKFIKQTAEILRDQFKGDIPDTIEGLVSLPGVGPKMAYLCMSAAWGRDEGIGVDVHVHRITNLWGWHKTSTPEQTRAELEAWLPKEKWHDINHLLVGFGQTYCPPVGRRCQNCDLFEQKLCPSAVPSSPVKKRVKREIEVKLEDGVVVKNEQTVEESDDIGIKIEIESPQKGQVLLQGRLVDGAVE